MVQHALPHEAYPQRTITLEEWAAMDEDEPGELVDGSLEEEEVPTLTHEAVVAWLIQHLRAWAAAQGGVVGGSEAKFRVTDHRGRKPDLFVYLPGSRRPRARDTLLACPPDILVEVISPRPRDVRRDRVEKAREYARFGVRYYWLMDPWMRTLELFELGADGRYVQALVATEGQLRDIPGCEGLTIDLDGLWGELDRLDEEEQANEQANEGS